MNSDYNTPRLLGAAFLLQAVASLASTFLLAPLIVPGNIVDSMTNISNNALQMRASIVCEMIAVIGIVMLGALLFITLREQNGKTALSTNYRTLAAFCICCPIPLGQHCSITNSSSQDSSHGFYLSGAS